MHSIFDMPNARDNDTWLKTLRAADAERDATLADLRALIRRDLPRGLSRWVSAEHSDFELLMEYTAQVSLAHVLNKLDTYQGRSHSINWVYIIAVRIALNEWHGLQWRDMPLGVAEKEGSNDRPLSLFTVTNRSPVSVSQLDDLRQRVQLILVEERSASKRMVLFAIYFQGMPIKEVARRLETNRNTLSELLHGARLRLIQRLEREGLAPKELLEANEKGDDSDSPSTNDQMPRSAFDGFQRRSKRRLARACLRLITKLRELENRQFCLYEPA